jgi:hypothetical protein
MNWSFAFRPKLVATLENYSAGTFFAGHTAGLKMRVWRQTAARTRRHPLVVLQRFPALLWLSSVFRQFPESLWI